MATQQSTRPTSAASAADLTSTPAANNRVGDHRRCTMRDGSQIHAASFVPTTNMPANPNDEITAFRVALDLRVGGGPGGCFYAARVQAIIADERFPVGGFVVFDWEAEPQDGDLVCAVAFVKERPDACWHRALAFCYGRSNRCERLIRRLGLPIAQPEERRYLLRRYVRTPVAPQPVHPVAMEVHEDGFCNFRLESLAGKPDVMNSPLTYVQPIAVLTDRKVWAHHIESVLI